jgi:hypothetical protein
MAVRTGGLTVYGFPNPQQWEEVTVFETLLDLSN